VFASADRLERLRPAVVLVAAKGTGPDFAGFLQLIRHQDYPDYRVILITQSAEDPAAVQARRRLGLGDDEDTWLAPADATGGAREIQLLVAGLSESEGQKVHNLRAGLASLRSGDELIAFADADIVGDDHWLGKLLAPLNLNLAEIASGYRWLVPSRPRLATWIASNINADIAILCGPSWHTLLWGGSMALTRETFDRLKVPELFRGSLNDDLQLTRAARENGCRMVFVRSLMAPSPVDYDWGGFVEFARRQYFQVRVYVPMFWWLGLAATTLWLAGVINVWVGVFRGADAAWPMIGAAFACGLWTHGLRGRYLRALFPEEVRSRLRGARSVAWLTTTVNFAVHWWLIVGSAFMDGVTWAGIRYRVRGRQRVEVLSRHP
jgi:cellulose synthase/poly-beta-1,6-N-acetylglucosamine synthase-like glycosyltransferase